MSNLFAFMFLLLPTISLQAVTVFNNTQKPINLFSIKYHDMHPRPNHQKQIVRETVIAQQKYRKNGDDVSQVYLRPGQIITKDQIRSCNLAVNQNSSSWAYIIQDSISDLDDYVGLVVGEDPETKKIMVERLVWEGSTIFNNTTDDITIHYLNLSGQDQTLNLASGKSANNLLLYWQQDENQEWKRTLLMNSSSAPTKIIRFNGKSPIAPKNGYLDLIVISRENQNFTAINHLH